MTASEATTDRDLADDATSRDARRGVIRELGYLLTTSLSVRMGLDAAAAAVALVLGFRAAPVLRTWWLGEPAKGLVLPSGELIPLFAVAFVGAGLAVGLYERRTRRTPWTSLFPACVAAASACVVAVLGSYFVTYEPIGRWSVVLAGLFAAAGTFLPRSVAAWGGAQSPRRIVFVGREEGHRALVEAVRGESHGELEVVAEIPCDGAEGEDARVLPDTCARVAGDLVVLQAGVPPAILDGAASCLEAGIPIWDLVTFFGRNFGRVPIECIDLGWTVETSSTQNPSLARAAKRLSDVVLAGVGLLVSLPLWPVLALAIKGTSPGPAFHVQERIGWRGRTFRIFKFRTMEVGAEQPGSEVWAREVDPRVTTIGRFLRRTRLDEIPQFLNVLRGEMSFVGPRPERPQLAEALAATIPHFRLRHLVKPGITGWAQVHLPYAASVEETAAKLSYDLFYVKHGGFLLDVRILFRTFGAVLHGGR